MTIHGGNETSAIVLCRCADARDAIIQRPRLLAFTNVVELHDLDIVGLVLSTKHVKGEYDQICGHLGVLRIKARAIRRCGELAKLIEPALLRRACVDAGGISFPAGSQRFGFEADLIAARDAARIRHRALPGASWLGLAGVDILDAVRAAREQQHA